MVYFKNVVDWYINGLILREKVFTLPHIGDGA